MDLVTEGSDIPLPAEGHPRRTALMVLGMHRSGTSALSGVLHMLGAAAPANLMRSDRNNQRGYWESLPIANLNDRILAAGGSRWWDWAAFEESNLDLAVRGALEAEIARELEVEYGAAPLIVIKDPRICRIVPLWLRALDRLGFEAKIVIPVRNPLETALSLFERDRLLVEEGLLLWLRHVLDAEHFTRHLPRCFVMFFDLLEDWRGLVGRIGADLQLEWPTGPRDAAEAIEQFLSPDLRHHERASQDLRLHPGAADWVVEAYDLLMRLGISSTPVPECVAGLSELRQALEHGARAFGPLILEREAKLDQATSRQKELVARIHAVEAEMARRGAEFERHGAQARQLEQKLTAAQAALVEKTAAAERLAATLEQHRAQVASAREAIRALSVTRPPAPSKARLLAERLCDLLAGEQRKGRRKVRRREQGEAELIRASGLFNAAWYLETYGDVRKAGIDPALHYLRRGAAERRNPSPHFSTRAYQDRYLDVATSGMNPLLHFLKFGQFERRQFDAVETYLLPRSAAATLVAAAEGGVTAEHLKFTRPGPAHEVFDPAILGGAAPDVKLLAYYLPQYHPIPENDRFWGKGFTEWRQVSRGLPRFPGHYQPRLPGDLGFYDLRDVETMRRQVALAKAAGIHGFAFYHYWFDGHRVLERPMENFLAAPGIDMPFMLIWANENWTRAWDGMNGEILLRQSYDPAHEPALLADLARHFRDPRYIRVSGRPLFVIYQPKHVPDAKSTFARWRARWKEGFGLEPLFFMAQTFGLEDPAEFGLDGAFEFPPHNLPALRPGRMVRDAFNPEFDGRAIHYDDVVAASLAKPTPSYPLVKTLFPSWDNDARRPMRGVTFEGSTPRKYQDWLAELVRRARANPIHGTSFVAVNAWNEWAEAAYLEPDIHFGAAYLNATARALAPGASGQAAARSGA